MEVLDLRTAHRETSDVETTPGVLLPHLSGPRLVPRSPHDGAASTQHDAPHVATDTAVDASRVVREGVTATDASALPARPACRPACWFGCCFACDSSPSTMASCIAEREKVQLGKAYPKNASSAKLAQ